MHDTLQQVTPDTIVILNEVSSSTSLSDAIFLNGRVLKTIIERDAFCVCMTLIDELAGPCDTIISTVSQG